jgi:methyl-accepting chemotaxis protein
VHKGDLTRRAEVEHGTEAGETAMAFNSMLDSFHENMLIIGQSSHSLASQSEEMSMVIKDAMQAMEAQNNETEMVASSISEMAATVREVSSNAAQAANSAETVTQQVSAGVEVANKAAEVINIMAQEAQEATGVYMSLEENSKQIGSILGVIKNIAEQTNLLALNAAIEAARAGEQGRGFAVVADEVRSLANSTQQSAEEIGRIIKNLQEGARGAVVVMQNGQQMAAEGAEHVEQLRSSLLFIQASVNQINDMNLHIASASEQQTIVAEEIDQNVNNIKQVATQNAVGAGQIADSSHQLAVIAEQLRSQVNQYRVA